MALQEVSTGATVPFRRHPRAMSYLHSDSWDSCQGRRPDGDEVHAREAGKAMGLLGTSVHKMALGRRGRWRLRGWRRWAPGCLGPCGGVRGLFTGEPWGGHLQTGAPVPTPGFPQGRRVRVIILVSASGS